MAKARRRVPIKLMLYWDAQGDAVARLLKEHKGRPFAALRDMAEDLAQTAEALRGLAGRLEGTRGIRLTAFDREIILTGVPVELAREAVKHTEGCAAITD